LEHTANRAGCHEHVVLPHPLHCSWSKALRRSWSETSRALRPKISPRDRTLFWALLLSSSMASQHASIAFTKCLTTWFLREWKLTWFQTNLRITRLNLVLVHQKPVTIGSLRCALS
jgi:hypothetical protein